MMSSLNVTGKVSSLSLVFLFKLIVAHVNPISAEIYWLFQDILQVRKKAYATYQAIFTSNGDLETEKSNHEEEEKAIFSNKFLSLTLEGDANSEEQDEDETDPMNAAHIKPKRKAMKKGKKGKLGKKQKGRGKQQTVKEPLDDVPFESYTAVTNVAISYINNTEYKIFLNFPGCDLFEAVTKISTGRDPDKAAQKIVDITIDYSKILTLLKPTHVIAFNVKD
ncbi:hypothetical protein FQN51_002450 [Onygenales sp. PD_10]|nr:hypothetical protein FQN51_002450 [Onygenales sp. PD_10]